MVDRGRPGVLRQTLDPTGQAAGGTHRGSRPRGHPAFRETSDERRASEPLVDSAPVAALLVLLDAILDDPLQVLDDPLQVLDDPV